MTPASIIRTRAFLPGANLPVSFGSRLLTLRKVRKDPRQYVYQSLPDRQVLSVCGSKHFRISILHHAHKASGERDGEVQQVVGAFRYG